MAAVVKAIHPRLSDVGFRKRRHTFNRSAEPGIIQVVNFQMGQRSLQGQFTVNFGVAIEEAWLLGKRDQTVQFPAFVNDYDCEIRERLGQILGKQQDLWWSLGGDIDGLADELGNAIVEQGVSWLNTRATREGILRIWAPGGLTALPMPTALPIVMILRHQDRPSQAEETLCSYYESIDRAPHKRFVHDVADYLGIDLPGLT